MKLYSVTVTATCPKEKQHLWKEKESEGYIVSCHGDTVWLQSGCQTADDFKKLDEFVSQYDDRKVVVREVGDV